MRVLPRLSSLLVAAVLSLGMAGAATGGYKIPDDCLGDWEYCDSLWLGNFDRFGRRAFRTHPFHDDEEWDTTSSPSAGHLGTRKSRLGCRKGRDVVMSRGFRQVRSVDCRGPAYTYVARLGEGRFRIRVSSRSGRILAIDPI
jgi:hypothetical protein